jgi:hypothetical protein
MKCRTASNGEAGGGALDSVVLPSPKKEDFRLDGAGRSRGTGADMRLLLVSYIEWELRSLFRRDQAEGGDNSERPFSEGVPGCTDDLIESAELDLDPAPIQDIRGVELVLCELLHCVAILPAFSSRDGSG